MPFSVPPRTVTWIVCADPVGFVATMIARFGPL
jgi:hypothetical protein